MTIELLAINSSAWAYVRVNNKYNLLIKPNYEEKYGVTEDVISRAITHGDFKRPDDGKQVNFYDWDSLINEISGGLSKITMESIKSAKKYLSNVPESWINYLIDNLSYRGRPDRAKMYLRGIRYLIKNHIFPIEISEKIKEKERELVTVLTESDVQLYPPSEKEQKLPGESLEPYTKSSNNIYNSRAEE